MSSASYLHAIAIAGRFSADLDDRADRSFLCLLLQMRPASPVANKQSKVNKLAILALILLLIADVWSWTFRWSFNAAGDGRDQAGEELGMAR